CNRQTECEVPRSGPDWRFAQDDTHFTTPSLQHITLCFCVRRSMFGVRCLFRCLPPLHYSPPLHHSNTLLFASFIRRSAFGVRCSVFGVCFVVSHRFITLHHSITPTALVGDLRGGSERVYPIRLTIDSPFRVWSM